MGYFSHFWLKIKDFNLFLFKNKINYSARKHVNIVRYKRLDWKQNRGRSFHTWCYQLVLDILNQDSWFELVWTIGCLRATAELRVEWRADQVRASFSEVWSPQQLCIAHSVQREATHHVGNIKYNIIKSLNENLPIFFNMIQIHFATRAGCLWLPSWGSRRWTKGETGVVGTRKGKHDRILKQYLWLSTITESEMQKAVNAVNVFVLFFARLC